MTSVRRTNRWRGIVAVALLAAAVGALAKVSLVMLLSVVGIVFAAYPRLPAAPDVALSMERELDEDEPVPGDEVTVTVRVHNIGQRTPPDLRIIDGVPPMLSVTEGTPRHMAVLRAGETTSFSYTVTAKPGTHRFEPATVLARDVAGTFEVDTTVATDTTIDCLAEVPELPLRRQTHQFAGEIPTEEGGSGVEFYRTREYHAGDSLARIDWRRYAKTGELSTVQFREERGASVVLCLDARAPCYRAPEPDEPSGVAYGRMAMEQLLAALTDTTDTVGISALSDRERCWLGPGTGGDHRARAHDLITSHPGLSTAPPAEAAPVRWDEHLSGLRRQLGSEAQVILMSPIPDDFAVEAALTLEAAGHAVTVISPDTTTDATVGGTLARTERHNRIHSLREAGVRVIDWPTEDSLGAVLVRATERWSR